MRRGPDAPIALQNMAAIAARALRDHDQTVRVPAPLAGARRCRVAGARFAWIAEHCESGPMNKLREFGPDFWRGLGATVVVPGVLVLYLLGLVVALIDEAFFGGEWTDQSGDWTFGAALFLGLATAYGYCCGYLLGRGSQR
jgi:hypothetical protein